MTTHIEALLKRHLTGDLPQGVILRYITIPPAPDGDYPIIARHHERLKAFNYKLDSGLEEVTLQKRYIDDPEGGGAKLEIFAGWGPITKTLVIAELETDDEAQPES